MPAYSTHCLCAPLAAPLSVNLSRLILQDSATTLLCWDVLRENIPCPLGSRNLQLLTFSPRNRNIIWMATLREWGRAVLLTPKAAVRLLECDWVLKVPQHLWPLLVVKSWEWRSWRARAMSLLRTSTCYGAYFWKKNECPVWRWTTINLLGVSKDRAICAVES